MKYLALFFLFPLFLSAQEKDIIFEMRDQQVKQLIISGQDHIDYYYEEGLITTFTDLAGVEQKSLFYYSKNDRLDSIVVHQLSNKNAPISRKIYEYNSEDQLIRTFKGQDVLTENVEVDSFFYNTQGQLIECRQYQNQLGSEFGFRRADFLILRNTDTHTYSPAGQSMTTHSSGWVMPSVTHYYYNSLGQESRNKKILNEQPEKQQEAGDRVIINTTKEYNDKGLLTKVTVSTAYQPPNGRIRSVPGKVRQKRRYSYYENL
ncbi:MAG: hypothetical protein AAGJ93_08540 [Bacteroidota bacterium]